MAIDDSLEARIPTDCPEDVREVLLHAWSHDLDTLKKLLDSRGKASAQDPTTGETPLHAAIRACGRADEPEAGEEDGEEDGVVEEARAVVQELFFSGAIWNDVDSNNETPGCVAERLGRKALYNMCVDAGVRAELLFALMEGYEQLSSGSEDGADEEMTEDAAPEEDETAEKRDGGETAGTETDVQRSFVPPEAGEKTVTSDEYLKSDLVYDAQKLVDSDLNGVMMSWETDIMNRSVASLIPDSAPGKRILNIGFGMGIIDSKFASLKPARHHIIEAHPAVLNHIATSSECNFGPAWEASGPEEGAFKVHAGKWQDVVPKLLAEGEVYDAIYFDTFGEDYAQLRMFFTEYVTGLMDQDGKFGFFNGLGADRKICYDVYTKVVEMHCADAGMDVEWEELDVEIPGMEESGKGEWEGVRRRYWTLKSELSRFLRAKA
jgi:protein arginine N-methyltransferase 2